MFLDRLYNLHWVTADVARSAQPYLGFYGAFVRAHGFRSIVNLRGANPDHRWWGHERQMARDLRVAHFDVRLSSRLLPARSSLIALFDAFDAGPRPLLLKCSGGQDRTGLASALYLLNAAGPRALAAAQAQFALWPYLHRPKRAQHWLKQFPGFAVESSAGTSIGEWVRHRYEPWIFAEWLAARGAGNSFLAIQTITPP